MVSVLEKTPNIGLLCPDALALCVGDMGISVRVDPCICPKETILLYLGHHKRFRCNKNALSIATEFLCVHPLDACKAHTTEPISI